MIEFHASYIGIIIILALWVWVRLDRLRVKCDNLPYSIQEPVLKFKHPEFEEHHTSIGNLDFVITPDVRIRSIYD